MEIKDYVIRNQEENVVEEETKTKKKATEVEYSTKLVSGPDFVINRKTKKTDRDLVMLVSAKQFYIKDNKDESVTMIRDVSEIKKFMSNCNTLEINSSWMKVFDKDDDVYTYFKYLLEFTDYQNFLKCNYDLPNLYKTYTIDFPLWKKDHGMYDDIYKVYGGNSIDSHAPVESLYNIYSNVSREEFRYYLEQTYASPLGNVFVFLFANQNSYYYQKHHDLKLYNINFKRFVEYAYFESYTQGYYEMNTFKTEYFDTLRMQKLIYGKVKDKYPKNLPTLHRILTLKYNLVKDQIEEEEFKKSVEKYQNYKYADSKYMIMIPQIPSDLADEGVSLSHCVKSYIGRVASGESKIVFMRKKSEPEESLITIEVVGDRVCQVKGYRNRRPDQNEYEFVCKWAKARNLEMNNTVIPQ